MKKQLTTLVSKFYGLLLNIHVLFDSQGAAKKAFSIFCKVRKGRVLPNQKEYLDAAKAAVHTVQDHDIQTYHWKGTKDTVILVHGWESNTWRWHKLIEHLAEAKYNIIAFDAPGHGNSSGKYLHVPLYAKVLQSMIDEYDPKFLIGHSVGGMTLLYNEHIHPSPIMEKIITIGSPSEFYEIMNHFKTLLGFDDSVLSALDSFINKNFGFTIREFSTSRYASTNTKKGLLLHDKLDIIAPYHASQQVHANWNGSQLISTEGLGHSMHQKEVNEQIIAFLES